jgi:ferric-dicitrate binding protein FerR (iron transport regulator)
MSMIRPYCISVIRPYLLSGWLLVFVAGSWRCSSRAGKPDAGTIVSEIPKDSVFKNGATDSIFRDGTVYTNREKGRKSIRLEDGSEVVMSANTKVSLSKDYNKQGRDCLVDGEVFFHVAGEAGKPFVVHTRSLQIFVLGTRFRVDAFADNAGEEVDLIEGKVRVQKSYHSTTDNEPEILESGEMVMINRDIDLMEKEKLDSAEWKKFSVN